MHARLREIQEILLDFALDETISADETGIFYGIAPANQYVPESAERAAVPDGDTKACITPMLWGLGNGVMGPSFNIIKCS